MHMMGDVSAPAISSITTASRLGEREARDPKGDTLILRQDESGRCILRSHHLRVLPLKCPAAANREVRYPRDLQDNLTQLAVDCGRLINQQSQDERVP